MGRTGKKNHISSKIDELLSGIKGQVGVMLSDTSDSYQDVSGWLKERGYETSKSSVGRYTVRSNAVTQRSLKTRSRTEALVSVARKNPDADYTEMDLVLVMDSLINRLITAEDEFDHLPLDRVGRLVASLSWTRIYKDKVRQDMKDKADLAFKEMKEEIMKTIKPDPELKIGLKETLTRAKELVLHD